ncbi:MAG: Hpt domain-containing protein [Bacteroidia bacterium]|nr:Hpt domain-containing protein [Bacteroidia bacterium]
MLKNEIINSNENVCNLKYLIDLMGSKKNLIKGIMDAFLNQVPEDLKHINDAILKIDYPTIKIFAHTMKSSVSIMGISVLEPILQKMEDLAEITTDIEEIKFLNGKVILICKQAMEEIEKEKLMYI